ncbi:homocysteine S-methyltransferase [Rhizohabitans arisaemae]|uniref:homocysteine S-methyltransferase n=1 Tax=Rhizohabitans arisaemae TaxID=2720610 RepID=UPI0024B0BE70|nr:homocysteine S-methyltransferase [Rhizohabitans arisaemae]
MRPVIPTALDGGLASELGARGHDLSDPLWSARLLIDAPQAIADVHLAYFRAGAQVATTASYQATFEGLAARGFGRAETAELLRTSVRLAAQARTRAGDAGDGRPLWIAASVGPYGAMLADGSEYRGRYGLSVAELTRFHLPRIEVLAEAGADVLALETVPDADEGAALIDAAGRAGLPVWLSYTVDGGRTRAGQSLEEAFSVAAGVDQVIAVGVNCCAPEEVGPALRQARAVTGKPGVAYPNGGEWDETTRTWSDRPSLGREAVASWLTEGALLIGGCCRTGPADIAGLAGHLAS